MHPLLCVFVLFYYFPPTICTPPAPLFFLHSGGNPCHVVAWPCTARWDKQTNKETHTHTKSEDKKATPEELESGEVARQTGFGSGLVHAWIQVHHSAFIFMPFGKEDGCCSPRCRTHTRRLCNARCTISAPVRLPPIGPCAHPDLTFLPSHLVPFVVPCASTFFFFFVGPTFLCRRSIVDLLCDSINNFDDSVNMSLFYSGNAFFFGLPQRHQSWSLFSVFAPPLAPFFSLWGKKYQKEGRGQTEDKQTDRHRDVFPPRKGYHHVHGPALPCSHRLLFSPRNLQIDFLHNCGCIKGGAKHCPVSLCSCDSVKRVNVDWYWSVGHICCGGRRACG